ncbi:uncharacterized protein TNCV_3030471 [Trichonephila clavipes]|nr:uncharacterized protein TNCV_3030471 [Trichonephila clavipes]
MWSSTSGIKVNVSGNLSFHYQGSQERTSSLANVYPTPSVTHNFPVPAEIIFWTLAAKNHEEPPMTLASPLCHLVIQSELTVSTFSHERTLSQVFHFEGAFTYRLARNVSIVHDCCKEWSRDGMASRRLGSTWPLGTTEKEDHRIRRTAVAHRIASEAEIRASVGTTVTLLEIG